MQTREPQNAPAFAAHELTPVATAPRREISRFSTSVIVPTYRRPEQLAGCLRALARQELPPDQVIVVVRAGDDVSSGVAKSDRGVIPDIVTVERRGQTHALNSALERAAGDIVAFTDDDAEPAPDWLARLVTHYADPKVGGVGGKVVVPGQTSAGSSERYLVGGVSAIGRPHGNHHLGDGPARDVLWLKGVNMSFRRELCHFDESLRGDGAQVANDSEIALRIHAAGWRIVYDPAASVEHFAGPRFDADARGTKSIRAMRDAVFNETLVLLRWLPPMARRRAFTYLLLVGVPRGGGPLGAIKAVAAGRRSPRDAAANCRDATEARIEALREWRAERDKPNPTPHAID
ncbi:MAG: glycosyltransferase family 2 protein [Solirubrobacterales bacterium]